MSRAILLSLVLHVLILFAMHSEGARLGSVPASVDQDLSATLARQPSVNSGQTHAVPEADHPLEKLTRRDTSRDPQRPENPARILPKIIRSTAVVDLAAKSSALDAVAMALPVERNPVEIAQASDSVSDDGIRRYRLSLAREARRFRAYPARARQQAWEGVVILRLDGAAGQGFPAISLEKGSGHPLLDDQALAMMASAVRETIMPKDLSTRSFVISLPIHYRLSD